MLFVMVAVGTGIGCSVVISQLFGAKRMEELKTAICTALMSILVFLVIAGISTANFLQTKSFKEEDMMG